MYERKIKSTLITQQRVKLNSRGCFQKKVNLCLSQLCTRIILSSSCATYFCFAHVVQELFYYFTHT